jgi:hypothetical protein
MQLNQQPHQSDPREQVAPLVDRLLDGDEQVMAVVLDNGAPATLRLLADCLPEAARHERGRRRTRAFAALRELGESAVPALTVELFRGRGSGFQVKVIGLLVEIGRELDSARRGEMILNLAIAGAKTRGKNVREALVSGLRLLRVASVQTDQVAVLSAKSPHPR